MQKVLDEGTQKNDRTGTGRFLFLVIRCVLTCRMDSRWYNQTLPPAFHHPRTAVVPAGNTNIAYLHENNVTIWDEWAEKMATSGQCMVNSGAPGQRQRSSY